MSCKHENINIDGQFLQHTDDANKIIAKLKVVCDNCKQTLMIKSLASENELIVLRGEFEGSNTTYRTKYIGDELSIVQADVRDAENYPYTCPGCEYVLPVIRETADIAKFAVCGNCATAVAFQDEKTRLLTQEELDSLPGPMLETMRAILQQKSKQVTGH